MLFDSLSAGPGGTYMHVDRWFQCSVTNNNEHEGLGLQEHFQKWLKMTYADNI